MDDPKLNDEGKKESYQRSILKTLSWRVTATMTTLIIAYLVFGSLEKASIVASIEFFAKMPIYYFHERAWQRAPRGTVRKLFRQKTE